MINARAAACLSATVADLPEKSREGTVLISDWVWAIPLDVGFTTVGGKHETRWLYRLYVDGSWILHAQDEATARKAAAPYL